MKTIIILFLISLSVTVLNANDNSSFYQADFVVDVNGNGDFRTLTEAITAVPDFCARETVIFLQEGIYKEKINIPPSKKNLKIMGKKGGKTVITWHDSARLLGKTGMPIRTPGTATFINASEHFIAANITIENSSAPTVGQAVALLCMGNRQRYINCHIKGNHDTLYLRGIGNLTENEICNHNKYYLFVNCLIEGTTDFIFGSATAYFKGCTILSKKNSYITAASTCKGQRYGFVFDHCLLIAAKNVNRVFLGRPWRIYAQTVFLNCFLGSHIHPEGWADWGKMIVHSGTVLYAEYNNIGPGAKSSGRVTWSRQLTTEESKKYALKEVWGEEVF